MIDFDQRSEHIENLCQNGTKNLSSEHKMKRGYIYSDFLEGLLLYV